MSNHRITLGEEIRMRNELAEKENIKMDANIFTLLFMMGGFIIGFVIYGAYKEGVLSNVIIISILFLVSFLLLRKFFIIKFKKVREKWN